MINFYWYDDGSNITIPKPDGIGYQLQTDLEGILISQKNDDVISFGNNTKGDKTYAIFTNKDKPFN